MTPTREQIDAMRSDPVLLAQLRAAGYSDGDFVALCDLALAALDLRERAAKVCDEYRDYTYGIWRDEGKTNTYMRACSDAGETLAERIRALPLTPDGADQQNSQAEQVGESVADSGRQLAGVLRDGRSSTDSLPARAGEPRCNANIKGGYCVECGGSQPLTGGCWKGRTQA